MAWPDDIAGRLAAMETRVAATGEAFDHAAAEADDATALRQVRPAQHALDEALAGVNMETTYLLTDAAKEFVWEHFRKEVVEPALKRMVFAAYAGQPARELTGEFVEESWSSQKLHLFKLVDAGETAADAHELIRKTVGFVDGGEVAMIEASRLIASADPAEIQAFADALSERLGSAAKAEAALALTTANIPQPCRAFWLK